MANNSEFYRGKRKKTAPALIATIIILAVIAFAVMLFYGLQKYIVVTNSGLHLEIPFLQDDSAKPVQSDDGEVVQQSFEPVNAQLEIGQADYSNIKAVAGEKYLIDGTLMMPFRLWSHAEQALADKEEHQRFVDRVYQDFKDGKPTADHYCWLWKAPRSEP